MNKHKHLQEIHHWAEMQAIYKDGVILRDMGLALAFSMPASNEKAYQVKAYWTGMRQRLSKKVSVCS